MTTSERAEALAIAASAFPHLHLQRPDQLLEVVRLELGHEALLDDFQAYGSGHAKAVRPEEILHIVSGNTPFAGLQSLIRGLLLGSRNHLKLPSQGLPELEAFVKALPAELQTQVQIEKALPNEWLTSADAVVVFGSDETIARFRAHCLPNQIFVPHGHKISFGIVFDDPENSYERAAADIGLHDQKGCLSLQTIYIDTARCGTVHAYGEQLGKALAVFGEAHPRGEITMAEETEIQHLRGSYGFRAATDPRISLFVSENSTEWTVICEEDSYFAGSSGNRLVFVKPLTVPLEPAFLTVRPHLSTIALWPYELDRVRTLVGLGASRFCALGESQAPPWTWHQDGGPSLARLVHWIDA